MSHKATVKVSAHGLTHAHIATRNRISLMDMVYKSEQEPTQSHGASELRTSEDTFPRANLSSSEDAQRQPKWTSLHQSDGFKMDHTKVSLSSKSESAGHLIRTAPAGSASLERLDLRIVPSETSSTMPSHQMNCCVHKQA